MGKDADDRRLKRSMWSGCADMTNEMHSVKSPFVKMFALEIKDLKWC